MPELPEVEVVRRGVQRWAVASTIDGVDVLHQRPLRRQIGGPGDFADRLVGTTVLAARRRGKFCWLELDSGEALVVHLGMSGQLLLQDPLADDEPHLRVRLGLTGGVAERQGRELRFVDQRLFGALLVDRLVPDPALNDGRLVAGPIEGTPGGGAKPPVDAAQAESVPSSAAHIAPDLLDPRLELDRLVARFRLRRTAIKRALLDQTLVSGIGNIYADEGLFRAGVHGLRSCERLTRGELLRVLNGAAEVMTAALAQGGTSFDSLYVDVNGSSGYFERSLAVYGREGRPCRRCSGAIRRSAFMGRSSFWCSVCQPAPRGAR